MKLRSMNHTKASFSFAIYAGHKHRRQTTVTNEESWFDILFVTLTAKIKILARFKQLLYCLQKFWSYLKSDSIFFSFIFLSHSCSMLFAYPFDSLFICLQYSVLFSFFLYRSFFFFLSFIHIFHSSNNDPNGMNFVPVARKKEMVKKSVFSASSSYLFFR